MKFTSLVMLFILCSFLTGAQDTYYWVGGTGNWSDLNHWQNETGNTPNELPDAAVNVVFNENSFIQSYDSVILNLPITECRDMIWENLTATVNLTTIDTTQQLHIYGSLHFDELVVNKFGGTVRLKSNEAGNTIQMNGISFNNALYFNGAGGEWLLLDNLTMSGMAINFDIGDIFLSAGKLVTNGHTIDCSSFFSNNNNSRQLDISNSTINLFNKDALDSWWVNFENLDFQAENSNIIVFADFASFHSAYGADPQYGNLQLKGTYNTIVNFEQVSFQKIEVEGLFCQLGNYFSADTVEINGNNCFVGPGAQIANLIVNAEQFSFPEGMYINRFISTGKPYLNGSNHFGYASFANEAYFTSNNTFDTLIFLPGPESALYTGGVYSFKSGTLQTVNDSLRIRGNECFNITLQKIQPGAEYAWIKKDYGEYDVQCDFLYINGVAAESATLQFYAGNSSIFLPNFEPLPGWTEGNSSGYMFGFNGMQYNACLGDTVILDASCFNGDEFTKYYWNEDTVPGGLTYSITEPQVVHIHVKYAENCYIVDYANIEFDSCENFISKVSFSKMFEIFPNPSCGIITVRSVHSFTTPLYTLQDLYGRIIFSNEYSEKGNQVERRFDFSNLQKGIYFFSVRDQKKISTQKIILD